MGLYKYVNNSTGTINIENTEADRQKREKSWENSEIDVW